MSSLTGDWGKLEAFLKSAPSKITKASEVGSNRAGALLAKRIKEGIRSQAPGGKAFEKLSELTIKRKGKSKALIDSGVLLRSVTWKKVRNGAWVGSNRRDESGKYNLADIHENGRTFEVSTKNGTKYIHIPARPFISPVVNDKDVQQELIDEYVKAIQEVLKP